MWGSAGAAVLAGDGSGLEAMVGGTEPAIVRAGGRCTGRAASLIAGVGTTSCTAGVGTGGCGVGCVVGGVVTSTGVGAVATGTLGAGGLAAGT